MKVITFLDRADDRSKPFFESAEKFDIQLHVLGKDYDWSTNAFKIRLLRDFLENESGNELYLVSDIYDVVINGTSDQLEEAFRGFDCDILFSAEANFYFREPDLHYYYWKFYPRSSTYYDYLNSGSFIGSRENLLRLIKDMVALYGIDLDSRKAIKKTRSDQYVYSRFYADCASGFFNPGYRIRLDHQQSLLGCSGGRVHAFRWPVSGKIHNFLFFKYERRLLKTFHLEPSQDRIRDLAFDKQTGQYYNRATQAHPRVIHLPATRQRFQLAIEQLYGNRRLTWYDMWKPIVFLISLVAYIQSVIAMRLIRYFNKGSLDQQQIFRYYPNQNAQMAEGAEKILNSLRSDTPFSFSHHNVGELMFMEKHLKNSQDQEWHGRMQQRYDPLLGERLLTSFTFNQPNHLVGVPCSICHPEQRVLAEKLRSPDQYTVPAMSIHHNQSFIPKILGALRGKRLYFMINKYQSLTVLEKLGLEVDPSRVITVPFLNSYTEYDKLKDRKFEEGSVVIMMCGMLAKILTKVWFENNPKCSFLALGSAMDDLIQKEKIRFRLFPKDFPFTRNIFAYRSFLFGYKKNCPECYDFAHQ